MTKSMSKIWSNLVFTVSAVIIAAFAIIGGVIPDWFGKVANSSFSIITEYFGWFFLLSVFVITLFLIGLVVSKYGGIRLGGEKERPEFPFISWVGMLFSAGFGVGLVFWGVAEPMSHFYTPPFSDLEGLTVQSARVAMGYAFFHWGISQWAIFAMVGLVIAFLQFRKQKNSLISTALEPVTGSRPITRNTIDSLSVIATVMGIATSIGLGVMQLDGGLSYVFGIQSSNWIQLLLIVVIFLLYMLSTTSGVYKGMKYLSNLNLGLAIGMLLFVFVTGPTVFILETFTLGLGDYLSNYISYSLRLQPYRGGTWIRDWTIFYWAWAIAWSPYVGAFIARVSKGRTIREFVLGVMIIPPVIACFWIATFGGTALWFDLKRNTSIAEAVHSDVTTALFEVLQQLPLTTIISVISMVLILIFLVTSADSATYVLSSMTSNGSLNPPKFIKFVWGGLMSIIAGVLLYTGGLEALQTASLVAALPFTVILLLLIISMSKLLRHEPLPVRKVDVKRFRQLEAAAKREQEKKNKEK